MKTLLLAITLLFSTGVNAQNMGLSLGPTREVTMPTVTRELLFESLLWASDEDFSIFIENAIMFPEYLEEV